MTLIQCLNLAESVLWKLVQTCHIFKCLYVHAQKKYTLPTNNSGWDETGKVCEEALLHLTQLLRSSGLLQARVFYLMALVESRPSNAPTVTDGWQGFSEDPTANKPFMLLVQSCPSPSVSFIFFSSPSRVCVWCLCICVFTCNSLILYIYITRPSVCLCLVYGPMSSRVCLYINGCLCVRVCASGNVCVCLSAYVWVSACV